MEQTRAIFLDIDGVLCTERVNLAYGKEMQGKRWHHWDEVGVRALHSALGVGDISLVISSTWRFPKHRDHLFEKLRLHHLESYLHSRMPWTPDMMVDGPDRYAEYEKDSVRGLEINAWLGANPEYTDYRIIDDIPQFAQHKEKKVIITDQANGLTDENIRALLRWAGALQS